MRLYIVTVRQSLTEVYEVEAESHDDAEERWFEGRLCGTDDNEPAEVLTVEEAQP